MFDSKKLISQLTILVEHMRGCKLAHLSERDVSIALEDYLWHAIEGNDDGIDEAQFDDAVVLDEDPAIMRTIGWLEGYMVDTCDSLQEFFDVYGVTSETLMKIWGGGGAEIPESKEPAPIRIYRVIKETLQLTTRTRLDMSTDSAHAIRITNVEADILDEYARQAAMAVVGELGL